MTDWKAEVERIAPLQESLNKKIEMLKNAIQKRDRILVAKGRAKTIDEYLPEERKNKKL